jgi:hypothetical protein
MRHRGDPHSDASLIWNLGAARHRARLRERVEICSALRRTSTAGAAGAALAAALRLGEEAAAELALIPDTPALRRRDAALLADDAAGPAAITTALRRLVEEYRNGRALDLFTASPTELLACCVARAGAG